jgi:hypothetical protein
MAHNLLTVPLLQALALWKKARRDKALTNKAALLATMACTTQVRKAVDDGCFFVVGSKQLVI